MDWRPECENQSGTILFPIPCGKVRGPAVERGGWRSGVTTEPPYCGSVPPPGKGGRARAPVARSYPRKSVAAHSTGEAHGTRVRGARGEGAPPRKGTGWIRDLRVLAFGARGGVARGGRVRGLSGAAASVYFSRSLQGEIRDYG